VSLFNKRGSRENSGGLKEVIKTDYFNQLPGPVFSDLPGKNDPHIRILAGFTEYDGLNMVAKISPI